MDWINIMAYDLHGVWDKKTGHHTAMRPESPDDFLTVPFALDYWMKLGAPAKKLALGLGTYGRTFTIADRTNTGLGSLSRQSGRRGQYTREGGFLAYYEICRMGLTMVTDNAAGAPYGYKGDQWIGFDTRESLMDKVALIKSKGLLGAMFWAYDLDDFDGKFCGQGPYPLMNAVKAALESDVTPTFPPQPTQPPKPPTEAPVVTDGPPQPPTQMPPVPPTNPPSGTCRAKGAWAGNPGMDAWCASNCAVGNCPATHCECS